jgi:hypothetical protein
MGFPVYIAYHQVLGIVPLSAYPSVPMTTSYLHLYIGKFGFV